ncbi:MAG: peroxiredoxin [Gammaproteobacteria bacterium]|nr:MAG: peroxiredoxin [Gammaproteobacteria bacterium]
MSNVAIGKKIPDFDLPGTAETRFSLADAKNRKVVLYFYPKDNTPGCTMESQDFRDLYPEFAGAGADVFGISRDSLQSHENFKAKYDLPFELLSDADETVCKLFDVLKEKIMYGRKVFGIERSTFLIDEDGVLVKEWRKVRVKGHAEEVLEAVREL